MKTPLVRFDLEEIVDLELSDFSPQNVIFELNVEKQAESTRLTLSPSYGLAGHIDAGRVSVSVSPQQNDQRTSKQ